jgi:GNAT superfamily N-acetyltransferase
MADGSGIEIFSVAERPELGDRLYDFGDLWPEFMTHSPTSNALFDWVGRTFPELVVVALDGGEPVARGRAVPFAFGVEGREELPDQGWDRVMQWGFADHRAGRTPTTASALEIAIARTHLGRGLSYRMIGALRDAARAGGYDALVAPVRPNEKHRQPELPMADYVRRLRPDGLPADAWIRAHVRVGGTVVKVCPVSMTFGGSLAEWRSWTGLPFDTDGDVIVPEALVPVHCDTRHDRAVYAEPNVWIRHDLKE